MSLFGVSLQNFLVSQINMEDQLWKMHSLSLNDKQPMQFESRTPHSIDYDLATTPMDQRPHPQIQKMHSFSYYSDEIHQHHPQVNQLHPEDHQRIYSYDTIYVEQYKRNKLMALRKQQELLEQEIAIINSRNRLQNKKEFLDASEFPLPMPTFNPNQHGRYSGEFMDNSQFSPADGYKSPQIEFGAGRTQVIHPIGHLHQQRQQPNLMVPYPQQYARSNNMQYSPRGVPATNNSLPIYNQYTRQSPQNVTQPAGFRHSIHSLSGNSTPYTQPNRSFGSKPIARRRNSPVAPVAPVLQAQTPEIIYRVQFKQISRCFTPHVSALQQVYAVGDFVMTNTHQGDDLGIVTDILPMAQFVAQRYAAQLVSDGSEDKEDLEVGHIIRVASAPEKAALAKKTEDEAVVLAAARKLVDDNYSLVMDIWDVEFQFDRKKIAVYYDCEGRVDFREIVKTLTSTFKSRVWMKKLSRNKAFFGKEVIVPAATTAVFATPDATSNENGNN